MAAGKRSRTAQGVTAERVILTNMGVIDDPYSKDMLAASWKPFVSMVQHWPTRRRPWSVTRTGLAARVLWHDAQLRASLEAGIRQVAVIGAGYDTRAWRFRRDGVVFYELDQAATQSDKRRRLPTPGPTYVEADLNRDDGAQALVRHGLDPSQPVHFIVEGVTMYLSEEVVTEQLVCFAAASGVRSRLAIDFYPPPDAGTSQDRRLMRAQRLARAGSGEGTHFYADLPQATALLAASGWDVEVVTNQRKAAVELIPHRFALPTSAINEHKTLAVAVS